jgi:hypothetical protein
MDDHEIARRLHDALTEIGARGSVRVHDGRWHVALLPGTRSGPNTMPTAGLEEEWLAALTDRLEAASGVRPAVETAD